MKPDYIVFKFIGFVPDIWAMENIVLPQTKLNKELRTVLIDLDESLCDDLENLGRLDEIILRHFGNFRLMMCVGKLTIGNVAIIAGLLQAYPFIALEIIVSLIDIPDLLALQLSVVQFSKIGTETESAIANAFIQYLLKIPTNVAVFQFQTLMEISPVKNAKKSEVDKLAVAEVVSERRLSFYKQRIDEH